MSYEKQTWATGDIIIAEKLNHMEDGIEGSYGLVLIASGTQGSLRLTASKTWNEIVAMMGNGIIGCGIQTEGGTVTGCAIIIGITDSPSRYTIKIANIIPSATPQINVTELACSSADDYPEYSQVS